MQRKRGNHNRMGKTRDLFKKTGDIKGTFHARMGAVSPLSKVVKSINRADKGLLSEDALKIHSKSKGTSSDISVLHEAKCSR